MIDDLNNVKCAPSVSRGYHHGDLQSALIAATMDIVEEVGPEAFSLRAAARRAHVSPAAPAYHFGDARGLLTASATIGFVELGEALEAAQGADRRASIVAQSHAYLQFALAKPGLFRLMWRKGMLNLHDPGYIAAADHAFRVSDQVVRGPQDEPTPFGDMALTPTIACWSMVHGFVGLVIDGAFFPRHQDVEHAFTALLDAMLGRLDLD